MDATPVMFRQATIRDLGAILEFWRTSGATVSATDNPEQVQRALDHPGAVFLVALAGHEIVGSLIGGYDGWRGNMYRLVVHPRFRRQGIARALVSEVEMRLMASGAVRITALVERDHPAAWGFWEAAGYSRDDRMSRYARTLRPEGVTR
jgi:ribosomal protein S18 acetylase RimI-like enzyme